MCICGFTPRFHGVYMYFSMCTTNADDFFYIYTCNCQPSLVPPSGIVSSDFIFCTCIFILTCEVSVTWLTPRMCKHCFATAITQQYFRRELVDSWMWRFGSLDALAPCIVSGKLQHARGRRNGQGCQGLNSGLTNPFTA